MHIKHDMGYDEDHEDRDEEGTDFREGLVEDSEGEETRITMVKMKVKIEKKKKS